MLKWREGVLDESFVSDGCEVKASSMADWTLAREGFVVVRMGEKEVGSVMCRLRTLRGVELTASLERERNEVAREAAMFGILFRGW